MSIWLDAGWTACSMFKFRPATQLLTLLQRSRQVRHLRNLASGFPTKSTETL